MAIVYNADRRNEQYSTTVKPLITVNDVSLANEGKEMWHASSKHEPCSNTCHSELHMITDTASQIQVSGQEEAQETCDDRV